MAYTPWIADYLRSALQDLPNVKEKKMFGSLAFLVNKKMCLNAGPARLMCRIDPGMHKDLIEQAGVTTVVMRDKVYKGYIYVSADVLKDHKQFDRYITLALDYNRQL